MSMSGYGHRVVNGHGTQGWAGVGHPVGMGMGMRGGMGMPMMGLPVRGARGPGSMGPAFARPGPMRLGFESDDGYFRLIVCDVSKRLQGVLN